MSTEEMGQNLRIDNIMLDLKNSIFCQCGHHRADHGGMGPSRGRPLLSACAICKCFRWRPKNKGGAVKQERRKGNSRLIWNKEKQTIV
jgi:hypothetical protein